MFKFYTCPFIYLLLVIIIGEIKTSEVPRPRGVSLSRLPLYTPDKDFKCLDGSLTIPFLQVNDDYCDCPDGSDEPGTSACPQGMFHCTNAGHRPLNIPSSRVNDGICDCCDASDEYAYPNSKCINNCNELGRSARIEAQKKAELLKIGSQIRAELSQKGVLLKQEKKEKLVQLNKNRNDAELIKQEKEALKKEIEELENQALEQYRIIEEEQKRVKHEEESRKFREEALEAFNLFDSNQDNKVSIPELQTRPTFDRDHDGVITEEEAKYFLDEHAELEFEEFFNVAWPKIKPVHMLNAGLFKPPQQASEVEDLNDGEEQFEEQEQEEEQDQEEEEETQEPEPETDPQPEEPKIEYDEDTKKLIEHANEARTQFNNADRAFKDIQNEIKDIEDSLQKDYGSEEEFAALDGQCFEYTDREYIYKLCPFDQVTQQAKSGGSDTRLGMWGSWVGEVDKYDTMRYDRGVSCWNGPQRTAHVHITCGSEHVLTSVSEPNRCEYVLEFTTPSACNPANDKSNDEMHDEL